MIDHRIAICIAGSIVGHLLAGELLAELPERVSTTAPRSIEVRVVAPPPEPEPEPQPTPIPEPAPEPPRVVDRRPQPPVRPTRPALLTPQPRTSTATGPATETPAPAVYGVTMESTSKTGGGPAVPVGNTGSPAAPRQPAAPPGPPAVAAAHEVTKMPMPRGRCSGTYTQAARDAGIEGVVVLDLVVDEHGRAREITMVSGLAHGLTEAAISALRTCPFDPGQRAGTAVPVRVRGFKIRFVLDS